MAKVQKVVSDLTGVEVDEQDAVQLIIRRAPGLERPVSIDALPSEVGGIEEAGDVCLVEIRKPGEPGGQELLCTLKALSKIAPDGNLAAVLEQARGLRGRPPGARNR